MDHNHINASGVLLEIIGLTDDQLDKELAFAEGFDFQDADAMFWHDLLKAEKAYREHNYREELIK